MVVKKKVPKKKVPKKKAPAKKRVVPKKKILPERNLLTKIVAPTQAEREAIRNQHKWPWPLRPYQQRAQDEFEAGKRRQGLFWHRRAGKDVFCLSVARNESVKRIGAYVHFFPKHIQAKRAIWNGVDPKKGAKFIDIAFADQEVNRNNTDMFIEMYNGSTWQLLGSDNYDRVVGGNIVGAFFSEWALCDPRAWDFIRPMILENDGFVFFITTFRGRNHAWQMAQNLKNNKNWHIDIMTVDQSRDINGEYIMSPKMIDNERKEGMSESLIQQEYYCNPDAVSDGAIYGRQIEHLRNDPVRLLAEWNPLQPVFCVWNFDLPVFASYLIIQPAGWSGYAPIILDAGQVEFTTLGEALAHVNESRWPIQQHYIMAHQREMAAAMSELRARPDILPLRNALTATTSTAAFLERVRLDGERCDVLLDALSGYVRNERFNPQSATVEFGPDPIMSWHWRLAYPLECFASLDYDDSQSWGSKLDYSAQDRAIKTVS